MGRDRNVRATRKSISCRRAGEGDITSPCIVIAEGGRRVRPSRHVTIRLLSKLGQSRRLMDGPAKAGDNH